MASILVSILGDQIYTTVSPCCQKKVVEAIDAYLTYFQSPDEKAEYLPSPEELKYKYLIRGKKLPDGQDEGDVSDEDEGIDTMDYVSYAYISGTNYQYVILYIARTGHKLQTKGRKSHSSIMEYKTNNLCGWCDPARHARENRPFS